VVEATIRPVLPSASVNSFPFMVMVVSPVRPRGSQLNVPAYVPDRSVCVVCCAETVGRSFLTSLGFCGSCARPAQKPPASSENPSVITKIFLVIILSSHVRTCAHCCSRHAMYTLFKGV